ncbi:sodium:solute symporter [Flammeovirga kamogawensis]|uniref:Sodium:solute symporter n=1 Tax=Flammeovirga kamogawensis TaxID=373891 RepID=A0ABX8GVR9_9BACT|nr:sodium:solute symporter [Flammeovirga kamogawensis]MBB6461124.1 SSS family transporter [Flammeovirga kamogawensis]QWG07690.1 sodium:solute symporter [Flammeovirga kamogawensis]TRX69499.1 sodium:solute symporter [Flammeovirga kamogawensis]
MSATTVALVILLYFGFLMLISKLTSVSGEGQSESFFIANRSSKWYLVAYGMVGATLSGVTFISVPGTVATSGWSYLQFMMGNMVGYVVIAYVLIPLFYSQKLISIYEYLKDRFGVKSYKTGSFFFMLSQTIGASFRLYLAALVLQLAFFDAYNIPFWVAVLVTIFLIWLYTFKGGIKTIVWTDTLQTTFLLLAAIWTIYTIYNSLNMSVDSMFSTVYESKMSDIFVWDWKAGNFFWKQFLAGIFITISMNGLDQNIMQKNLTCKNVSEAQKNVLWFALAFFIATVVFLFLGVLLYEFAAYNAISLPTRSDELYPMLALHHFGLFTAIVFLLGIIAAAFSSADSALTALTTAFCIDFLNLNEEEDTSIKNKKRKLVHVMFSFILFLVIVGFRLLNDDSVVSSVFKAAGYTYGPLLGLFVFGIFTKKKINDNYVLIVCLLSPVLSYILNIYSTELLFGYQFGFEILLVNAGFTMLGLTLISKK